VDGGSIDAMVIVSTSPIDIYIYIYDVVHICANIRRSNRSAAMERRTARKEPPTDSFATLVEIMTQEPTLLGCLRILQGTCLSQGIKCTIRGKNATPEFAEFVTLHYSTFCENAIRCIYMCGFVPWRLRKIPGGDVVPEVLPVGSFRWSTDVRNADSQHSTSKQKLRESVQQRQKRALARQNTPFTMSDSSPVIYQVKFVQSMPFQEDVVEIYEHAQPHIGHSPTVSNISSPLAHVIVDYRIMRQAQLGHAYADSWNTQAKIMCAYKPLSDPYRVNEGNAITSDWGYARNRDAVESDTNIPTDMEYNVFVRDNSAETMDGQKPTDHTPLIYSLPQNTSTEAVQTLQPIQNIDQLNARLAKNISSVMGIPFEMISGGYPGSGAASRSVQNSRIFATNMLSLCRHLQELLRSVYVAAYGGDHKDVCFTLRPSPRICLENVDDLVKLLASGVVSCGEASHISNMLLGVELLNGHGNTGGDDQTMYRTPEQALAEKSMKLAAKQPKPIQPPDSKQSKPNQSPDLGEAPIEPKKPLDK
jgi:hypothetical protein